MRHLNYIRAGLEQALDLQVNDHFQRVGLPVEKGLDLEADTLEYKTVEFPQGVKLDISTPQHAHMGGRPLVTRYSYSPSDYNLVRNSTLEGQIHDYMLWKRVDLGVASQINAALAKINERKDKPADADDLEALYGDDPNPNTIDIMMGMKNILGSAREYDSTKLGFDNRDDLIYCLITSMESRGVYIPGAEFDAN